MSKKMEGNRGNLYEMSEERRALRQAIKEALQSGDHLVHEIASSELSKLKGSQKSAVENIISEMGGMSAVKEKIVKEKNEFDPSEVVDTEKIESEMGPEFVIYDETQSSVDNLSDKVNKTLRQISISGDKIQKKTLQRLVEGLTVRKQELLETASKISRERPDVARAHELVEYIKGLHAEGHIAMTPSVAEYVSEIESKMLSGKPMFLHGPTGTGKTSLARFAAQVLTGKTAEMVYCNQQTRESNIWGKQGIKVTEKGQPETVDVLGPLARAIAEGKPIIFDEFNSLEEDQMRMIKGIFGYEPGDDVPITGNGKIKMAPGFQMIMTANLKSEKHPDRKDLPDEMKREFEQNNLEIGYNPEFESFDIMLARLMNSDGSIDMSWHDLNVTLPKLASVMNSIQTAYVGEVSEADAKNIQFVGAKKPNLRSFVMTHGSIEAMIDLWNVEGQTGRRKGSFMQFIDERIKTALTFKAYTEDDRILAAKIFASKGFLTTVTPEELGLPKDIFRGIKTTSAEQITKNVAESGKVAHVSLKQLLSLDPFEQRKNMIKPLDDFSSPEGGPEDDFTKQMLDRLNKIRGVELSSESISEILNRDYESQHEVISALKLLETLSDGREGIKGINNQEYAFPTIDEVFERLSAKQELIEQKLKQYENPMLMIVPIGLPLKSIRDAWKVSIVRHKDELHNPDGTVVEVGNWALGGKEFENTNSPLWVWDKYANADISGDLIYDPRQYDQTNHGGKIKSEILDEIGGFSILITENTPNLPTDTLAKTLDGRKQILPGQTPEEYLNAIKTNPQYAGESGLYIEEEMWFALTQLEKENGLVVNNWQGDGKVGYAISNYFKSSGGVPRACWRRDRRRAVLGGDGSGDRRSHCSARASVKV